MRHFCMCDCAEGEMLVGEGEGKGKPRGGEMLHRILSTKAVRSQGRRRDVFGE